MTSAPERDWLALLVHEVRSPVAALSAIAEAYREADAEARRSLAALAVAACAGIARTIADTTLDSVVRRRVEVGRLAEEAAAAAALRGGNVRAEVEHDLPRIAVDPLRLRQALDNLVANALTHGGSGEVVVAARSGEGAVLLSVTDRGAGVPEGERERIFGAGVRLDASRPGSGLGLAVARAIAHAHGGTVHVESAPGGGARFVLTLPADEALR